MSDFIKVLSSFVTLIEDGLIFENVINEEPLVIEWEDENGTYRYDDEKKTVFFQPKTKIENLDLNLTILPTGCSLDE